MRILSRGITSVAAGLLVWLVAGLGPVGPSVAFGTWSADRPGGPGDLGQPVAIFGKDDRTAVVRATKSAARSVGLLFNNSTRKVCSAFCVGPDMIATAAHCLFPAAADEQPLSIDDAWFTLDAPRHRIVTQLMGSGNHLAAANVVTGSTRLSVRPPIDASSDWALARLAVPVCRNRALPIVQLNTEEVIAAANSGKIANVAFHRDFGNWQPAADRGCAVASSFEGADAAAIARDFVHSDRLILHRCDTANASSGSPLLIASGQGYKVIGINVGTYVQSQVLVGSSDAGKAPQPLTVANTGVNAAQFADALTAFAAAEVVGSSDDVAALQSDLAAAGYYRDDVDGAFGDKTRAAIAAYEFANGLTVLGVPTVALMKRLHRVPPLPERKNAGSGGRPNVGAAN